ncbi:hypothetical protein [Streptomyces sp. NPDC059278]|uniref:hypothetical protein n=1 Tax=Streptomyces sp. NPDC059278 TaxID=3346801 RepID=UPI0036C97CFB
MFGKKTTTKWMTPAEAEAALNAIAEKNDRLRAKRDTWVTCANDHIQYSGGRSGCHVSGCQG